MHDRGEAAHPARGPSPGWREHGRARDQPWRPPHGHDGERRHAPPQLWRPPHGDGYPARPTGRNYGRGAEPPRRAPAGDARPRHPPPPPPPLSSPPLSGAKRPAQPDAGTAPAPPGGGADWASRRAHYDRQAHPDADRALALRRRAHGPLIAYKKLANGLKRAQVDARRGARLLADVGCGRGGDLAKWWDGRIARVVATDLSPAELDEAKRRERELAAERRRANRYVGAVEWHAANSAEGDLAARLLGWSGGALYDGLSCQFALQFFWGSADSAAAVLRAVAACLREGGAFFGLAPDGDAIERLCAYEGDGRTYECEEPFGLRLRLHPHAEGGAASEAPAAAAAGGPSQPPPASAPSAAPLLASLPLREFGQLVTFALDDTVTAGSDESACTEFLLRPATLHALAREAGLQPIAGQCGPMLEQAGVCGLRELPEAQRRVASLYFCFAFTKAAQR